MATDFFAGREAARAVDVPSGSETLRDKAERCRRLAAGISDRQAAEVLRTMALQYEQSSRRPRD